MDKEVREYWEDFCAEHGIEKDVPVEAWAFGIGGKQADYLAELVNRGKKTATTSGAAATTTRTTMTPTR